MSTFLHCPDGQLAVGLEGEKRGIKQLPPSEQGVIAAAFRSAWRGTLTSASLRMVESLLENPPDQVVERWEDGELIRTKRPRNAPTRRIDAKLANELYGGAGARFGPEPVPEGYAALKDRRKREANFQEAMLARADSVSRGGATFVAETVFAIFDPVAWTLGFFLPPVAGLKLLARIGSRRTREFVEEVLEDTLETFTRETLVEIQDRADQIGRDNLEFLTDLAEDIGGNAARKAAEDVLGGIFNINGGEVAPEPGR